MDNLYYNNILNEQIIVPCDLLGNNLDTIVLNILKNKIGNKCINEGYVDKDSIEIIKRSLGKVETNNLNGSLLFIIQYKAKICNPLQNNVIECVVDDNNKLGIIAINKPLEIFLTKRHHENKDFFKTLKKNDKIIVKIIDKNFKLYDKSIIVIGKYIKQI